MQFLLTRECLKRILVTFMPNRDINDIVLPGLCDEMWGDAFYYEDTKKCMVMYFNPDEDNPNLHGENNPSSARRIPSSVITLLPAYILAYFA